MHFSFFLPPPVPAMDNGTYLQVHQLLNNKGEKYRGVDGSTSTVFQSGDCGKVIKKSATSSFRRKDPFLYVCKEIDEGTYGY